MENQDYQNYQTQPENEGNDFGNTLLNATIHFFISIFYFLFGVPFGLWSKAISRLAAQRESGALKLGRIKSLWPLLSFLKAFLFEFLFDAIIFIAYPVGILIAFYNFFDEAMSDYFYFKYSFEQFLATLIAFYYLPIFISIIRDLVQLGIVLPFRKLVSFLYKPAQHLDLTVAEKK